MIYIIDDDILMAKCIEGWVKTACDTEVLYFSNGIEAMQALDEKEVPDLIFLDILLDGPDGFSFLNEISSYTDTERIPIVVISSLKFKTGDLKDYGVVKVLNKSTMTPNDIKECVEDL